MWRKYKKLLESEAEMRFHSVEHKSVRVFGPEWLRGVKKIKA